MLRLIYLKNAESCQIITSALLPDQDHRLIRNIRVDLDYISILKGDTPQGPVHPGFDEVVHSWGYTMDADLTANGSVFGDHPFPFRPVMFTP